MVCVIVVVCRVMISDLCALCVVLSSLFFVMRCVLCIVCFVLYVVDWSLFIVSSLSYGWFIRCCWLCVV